MADLDAFSSVINCIRMWVGKPLKDKSFNVME